MAFKLWEIFTYANSANPALIPKYAVSDQGQQCLFNGTSLQISMTVKKHPLETPNTWSGLTQMIRMDRGQSRINPVALRKAKIVYNFGLSECKRMN